MSHATVPEAIDAAEPEVAELITRLATEEAAPDPFDAVVRMLTETARREVASLAGAIAAEPEPADMMRLQHWLTRMVDQLARKSVVSGKSVSLPVDTGWRGQRKK